MFSLKGYRADRPSFKGRGKKKRSPSLNFKTRRVKRQDCGTHSIFFLSQGFSVQIHLLAGRSWLCVRHTHDLSVLHAGIFPVQTLSKLTVALNCEA